VLSLIVVNREVAAATSCWAASRRSGAPIRFAVTSRKNRSSAG
jgi:hypothetical protein